MDFNTVITNSFIQDLKCSLCENYLSYFPIHITSKNGNVCGRCEVPKDDTYIWNGAYEIIAKEVEFPCRYITEGCTEKLLAKDIKEHEDACCLRKVKCPASHLNACRKSISLPNVLEHCQEAHSDLILSNGEFQLDLSEETSNIFEQNHNFFIFKRDFNTQNNNLRCELLQVEPKGISEPETCHLVLKNNSRSITIDENCFDVNLDILKSSNSLLNGILTIGEQNPYKIEETLHKKLKCHKCSGHLQTPLHPIDKRFHCDNLIRLCKFNKNGCNLIDFKPSINQHELICSYAKIPCPVWASRQCTWCGPRKNVMAHVTEEHYLSLAQSSEFTEKISDCGSEPSIKSSYIIKFSKYTFRLFVFSDGASLIWFIHALDELKKMFQFELTIKSTDNRRELLALLPCVPEVLEKEPFKNLDQYCRFPLDMLKYFACNKDTLTYRIRIIT